jgi:hypothetical protein
MKFKFCKRCILLIIIALISGSDLFSQAKFEPGYVIAINGDSLKGFIKTYKWKVNPQSILFKAKLNDAAVTFKPLDIKEFGIKDRAYAGAAIEASLSPNLLKDLDMDAAIYTRLDTVFLSIIVKGEKGLYYYRDKFGRINFYITKGQKFELLKYKEFYSQQTRIVENNTYYSQLKNYLDSCRDIESYLIKRKYRVDDLRDLFQYYYTCANLKVQYLNTPKKSRIEYGILGGYSISDMKINSSHYPEIFEIDFSKSKKFTIGGFFNIILTDKKNKLLLCNELGHSNNVYEGSYITAEKATNSAYFEMDRFMLSNYLQFRHENSKITLFGNIGIVNSKYSLQMNYLVINFKNYRGEMQRYEIGNYAVAKLEQGLIAGFGVMKKNWKLEARYEIGNGFSKNDLTTTEQRFHILLGIKVNKTVNKL